MKRSEARRQGFELPWGRDGARKTTPRASSEQLLDLRVDDMNDEGFGVAETGGRETWIPGAFPGERVRARPRRGFGEILLADLIEVLEPDADRTVWAPPVNPVARAARSCSSSTQLNFASSRNVSGKRSGRSLTPGL